MEGPLRGEDGDFAAADEHGRGLGGVLATCIARAEVDPRVVRRLVDDLEEDPGARERCLVERDEVALARARRVAGRPRGLRALAVDEDREERAPGREAEADRLVLRVPHVEACLRAAPAERIDRGHDPRVRDGGREEGFVAVAGEAEAERALGEGRAEGEEGPPLGGAARGRRDSAASTGAMSVGWTAISVASPASTTT